MFMFKKKNNFFEMLSFIYVEKNKIKRYSNKKYEL